MLPEEWRAWLPAALAAAAGGAGVVFLWTSDRIGGSCAARATRERSLDATTTAAVMLAGTPSRRYPVYCACLWGKGAVCAAAAVALPDNPVAIACFMTIVQVRSAAA